MKNRLVSALMAWAIMAACLFVPEIAQGFFSRGVIDGDLGYSSVEIYKDQEDYWGGTGLYSGRRSRYGKGYRGSWYGWSSRDEYYLTGVLENLTDRPRRWLRVAFYASDCIRERTHWTVTVEIDSLGPHQSIPFRQFISYSEPKFPCRFRFHVTEEAPPPDPPQPVPVQPLPPPEAEPPSYEAPLPPDDSRIYKWVDENGISHYTNRSVQSEDGQWEPAWEEE